MSFLSNILWHVNLCLLRLANFTFYKLFIFLYVIGTLGLTFTLRTVYVLSHHPLFNSLRAPAKINRREHQGGRPLSTSGQRRPLFVAWFGGATATASAKEEGAERRGYLWEGGGEETSPGRNDLLQEAREKGRLLGLFWICWLISFY